LKELVQLEELYLRRNNLEEIPREIEYLTNLKVLDIYRNSIEDIHSLQALTSLESLNLGYNAITNLNPLRNHPSLSELYMHSPGIGLEEISFLEELKGLKKLEITIRDGVDPEPINHLESLENLLVLDSEIDTLKFLSSLENLK